MADQTISDLVAPSEGLASNMSDLLRPKTKAKVLNNVRMLRRGIWTSRRIGWQRQRQLVFTDLTDGDPDA